MRYVSLLAVLLMLGPIASAKPHWYSSKRFWIALGIQTAAMSADYAESQHAFHHGAIEADPLFGERQPSFGRMFSIGLPIEVGYAYADYKLSVSKHKLLRIISPAPTLYQVEEHSYLAAKAASY